MALPLNHLNLDLRFASSFRCNAGFVARRRLTPSMSSVFRRISPSYHRKAWPDPSVFAALFRPSSQTRRVHALHSIFPIGPIFFPLDSLRIPYPSRPCFPMVCRAPYRGLR